MTFNELMGQSLSALLEKGEVLQYPIYGVFLQKNITSFGYFGIAGEHILVALLKGDSKEISWTSRIPLDIKEVVVKKTFIPSGYNIHIDFHAGEPMEIKVSKKVHGIDAQEKNLEGFVNFIQNI